MMEQQHQTLTAATGGALRRMILLLAVAAVMAAMALAMAAAPSMASNPCDKGEHLSRDGSSCVHGGFPPRRI